MSEKYYRVKVQWPTPYFLADIVGADLHSVHDARFYTTATDLRGVYLDIQTHLANNYAPEGLNEVEDLDDAFTSNYLEPEHVLKAYSHMHPALDFEVECIGDPEQVGLISDGLGLIELIKPMLGFITSGFIPVAGNRMSVQIELADIGQNLERLIRSLLRFYQYDDDLFEQLSELINKANHKLQEINTYAQEVSAKYKESQA